MRHITTLLLAATLAVCLPLGGCAALSLLPTVIAAVVDGAQVIDAIADFVGKYFANHPDAATQAKIDAAIQTCRAALNTALRTAQGTDDLSNAKVDSAFDNFKAAYIQLLALVRPYGVAESGTAKLAAPQGDHLTVPTPLALTLSARGK